MGVSVYIQGIRPFDDRYKKIKAAHDACVEARVSVPKEVSEYLTGTGQNDYGIEVEIEEAVKDMRGECDEGTIFLVDLTKIPKDVTMLRIFYG